MAKLIVEADQLRVRLRLIEQLATLRRSFSVPLAHVTSIEVREHPLRTLDSDVKLPGGLTRVLVLAACKLRGRVGRAFVAVYLYRSAVVVTLHENARYQLLVVSNSQPSAVAKALRDAVAS